MQSTRYRRALLATFDPYMINMFHSYLYHSPLFPLYSPGITLYTLHLPVVLLANKEIQCGNMDHNQFLSKLEEAEALLKEALALLFYEPAKTPEGMLAIEAKEALKCLRETIMDVKDQVVTSHMRSIQ